MVTAQQLRMAKAALNWSLEEWAEKTGLSAQGLRNLHNDLSKPRESTLEKIVQVFESHGIEFVDGGARQRQKIVEVYEGDSCYLRILDEIIIAAPSKVMFSGADERRSTPESMKRLAEIRKADIGFRNLIKHGDTYIMGAIDEYRWMPEGLFIDGDVKVIYDNTVVYFASWLEVPRVIKITDKNIADENKKMFNYLWKIGQRPSDSTSDVHYD